MENNYRDMRLLLEAHHQHGNGSAKDGGNKAMEDGEAMAKAAKAMGVAQRPTIEQLKGGHINGGAGEGSNVSKTCR